MVLPTDRGDREFTKFKDTVEGTAVKTSVVESILPNGAATEASLLAILAAVDQLEGFVDGLEGFSDGLEGLLAAIGNSTDGLEGFTDGLEGLLVQIRDNADQLEGLLDGVETTLTAISTAQTNGTQKTQLFTPTPLTVKQAAITVGTSAVRLTTDGSAPAATRVALVAEPDPNSIANFWVGSSTVTGSGATRGVPFAAGEKLIVNNDAADYYIISDTAAQTVFVMEQE